MGNKILYVGTNVEQPVRVFQLEGTPSECFSSMSGDHGVIGMIGEGYAIVGDLKAEEKGRPYNYLISHATGLDVYGNVVISKYDNGQFVDMTNDEVATLVVAGEHHRMLCCRAQ